MSRLRTDITTVFDVFTEVAAPSDDGTRDAWILLKYPEDYDDKQKLANICDFSFPCGVAKNQNDAVQQFSFVLTDGRSQYTFGYCRYTPTSNTCLCILSALPWTSFFYRLLNHLANILNTKKEDELEALLVRAYHQEVPGPGETFFIESSLGKNKLETTCPDHTKLPSIPENRCVADYYSAVNHEHMIYTFASLLRERRILFVGRKLCQLSSCVMAANMLIYPLHWQHIFVPVLPEKLFDYLHAPMPFLIGISSAGFEKAKEKTDLQEVVIIDIDKKTIVSPYEDWKLLPSAVLRELSALKHERTKEMHYGDGFARLFLRAMVKLLGDYRRGLVWKSQAEKYEFDSTEFLRGVELKSPKSSKLKDYLAKFVDVQIFQQFIEERVDAINAGYPIRDEFESEVANMMDPDENRYYRFGGAKDLVLEKGMEAWSDIQDKMSKIKEASLKPGFSPTNIRKLPRPLSAAGAITTSMKDKIPRYGRSKHAERRTDSLWSFEDRLVTSKRSGSDEREDSEREEQNFQTNRTLDKLFSDQEMNDILNKRTSVLVKYDGERGPVDEQKAVKSSKSLSDLLTLDVTGDSVSTDSNNSSSYFSSQPPVEPVVPRSTTTLNSVTNIRISQSAANLQLRGSPVQTSPVGRPSSLQHPRQVSTPSPVLGSGKQSQNLIELGHANEELKEDDIIFDPLEVKDSVGPFQGTVDISALARPSEPFVRKTATSSSNMKILEELFTGISSCATSSNGGISNSGSFVDSQSLQSVSKLKEQWEKFDP